MAGNVCLYRSACILSLPSALASLQQRQNMLVLASDRPRNTQLGLFGQLLCQPYQLEHAQAITL